jgi:uncharacterized protein (DUF1778 family)
MAQKRAPKKTSPAKADMLRIRITPAQRTVFDAAAKRLGMGLSAFARMSMIERARKEGIEA